MCTITRDIAFNGLLLDNNHKVGAAQDIRTIAHGIPQSPYRSRNTCTTSREMLLSNRKPPCHISDDESESDSSSKCVGNNRLFAIGAPKTSSQPPYCIPYVRFPAAWPSTIFMASHSNGTKQANPHRHSYHYGIPFYPLAFGRELYRPMFEVLF